MSYPSTSGIHGPTSPPLSPLSSVQGGSQIDGTSDDSAMSGLSNISEFISQDTPDSISLHQGKFIVEKSFKLLILPAISFLYIFVVEEVADVVSGPSSPIDSSTHEDRSTGDDTVHRIESMRLGESSVSISSNDVADGGPSVRSPSSSMEAALLRSPDPSPPICLLCRSYMFAPVYQCRDGHSVCKFCYEKWPVCAFCKLPREHIRNRYIEDQSGDQSCPCKYKELGCGILSTPEQWNTHVEYCFYNPDVVTLSPPSRVNNE